MNAICKAYVLSHEKCIKPYVLLNIRVTLHENMITKRIQVFIVLKNHR